MYVAYSQVHNSGQVGGCGGVARRVDGGVTARGGVRGAVRARLPAARRALFRPAALRRTAVLPRAQMLVCTLQLHHYRLHKRFLS